MTEDTPGASRPTLSLGACGVNRISTTYLMGSLVPNRSVRRSFAYGFLALSLLLLGPPIHRSTWLGSAQLHTLIETITTLLGLTTGAMALVRYYPRKSRTYSLLGR